jgi:hypothetical protein
MIKLLDIMKEISSISLADPKNLTKLHQQGELKPKKQK